MTKNRKASQLFSYTQPIVKFMFFSVGLKNIDSKGKFDSNFFLHII